MAKAACAGAFEAHEVMQRLARYTVPYPQDHEVAEFPQQADPKQSRRAALPVVSGCERSRLLKQALRKALRVREFVPCVFV